MELQIQNYKDKHEYISENGIRSVVYLMDCLDGLKQIPDKYFELAIVDPPYGININMNMGRRKGEKAKHAVKKWDKGIPSEEYFDGLLRIILLRLATYLFMPFLTVNLFLYLYILNEINLILCLTI